MIRKLGRSIGRRGKTLISDDAKCAKTTPSVLPGNIMLTAQMLAISGGAAVVSCACWRILSKVRKNAAASEPLSKLQKNAAASEPPSQPADLKPVGQALRVRGGASATKFPWGDTAFHWPLLPWAMGFGATLMATAIALTTSSASLTTGGDVRGPIMVTLLFTHGLFQAIKAQISVNFGGGNAQAKHVAERSLYNSMEQGLPFLLLMWMTAAFVDAALATSIGMVFAIPRYFYPLAYGWFGQWTMPIAFISQPTYQAQSFLWLTLFAHCFGFSLLAVVGQNFFVWFCICFGFNRFVLYDYFWQYPFAKWAAEFNLAANKEKSA